MHISRHIIKQPVITGLTPKFDFFSLFNQSSSLLYHTKFKTYILYSKGKGNHLCKPICREFRRIIKCLDKTLICRSQLIASTSQSGSGSFHEPKVIIFVIKITVPSIHNTCITHSNTSCF